MADERAPREFGGIVYSRATFGDLEVLMQYFRPQGAISNWGDYGTLLAHGMSRHLKREDGLIQLERTGPFIPPMTCPGIADVVITQALRAKLEASRFTGLGFRSVIKRHIADLDWSRWDRSADEPRKYPPRGEPEGYILGRPHAPAVSARMGDLWELRPTGKLRPPRGPDDSSADASVPDHPDFALAPRGRYDHVLVSERARDWLVPIVGEWIDFTEARVADY